jgi:hypothetical protein
MKSQTLETTKQQTENLNINPESAEMLILLQADKNELIECNREALAEAVCFLGTCLELIEDESFDMAVSIINNLSHLRNDLGKLRKPLAGAIMLFINCEYLICA